MPAIAWPHAVATVLEALKLTNLTDEQQRAIQDAIALLDDRDRAVEDWTGDTDRRISATSGVVPGVILPFAGPSAPAGYLSCDGSIVSRSVYAPLFTAIGTTWGAGDGSTTFGLPDLRGRTLLGSGTGAGLTARTMAATGGEETHQLDATEMPTHNHSYTKPLTSQTLGVNFVSGVSGYLGENPNSVTGNAGGGNAHNNMQPFAVVAYIIKT